LQKNFRVILKGAKSGFPVIFCHEKLNDVLIAQTDQISVDLEE
jgi:hypothetical protein